MTTKINKGHKWKKGHIPWNKGKCGYKTKPCSDERKIKIGLANAIKSKGKTQSIETRIKRSMAFRGEKNHQWQGGKTSESQQIRRGIEFRLWRESVFARDGWICQKCGIKSGCGYKFSLHPHHVQNFAQYPELRFAIDNGITFCKDCHMKFHNKYGRKDNNKQQLKEFLNQQIK